MAQDDIPGVMGAPGGPGHSSCLESLYVLSLYDEPSAAVDGVGELRLDTASLPLPR